MARKFNKTYHQYGYLCEEHIVKHKPIYKIAEENNVSGDTIRRSLLRNNIDYWTTQYREKLNQKDIDKIEHLYCIKNMSANAIGNILNISHKTVIRVLNNRGIATRNISQSQFNHNHKEINKLYNDAEWLNSMYWEEGKTSTEIAKELGIHPSTVLRNLKRLGIKTKNSSEAKKGQMIEEKHPNWQGGLTPLKRLLRQYFKINQVPIIAQRDHYTCQLCGAEHTILHIHHIRSFNDIIGQIVSEYKELNPDIPKDRIKLYRLIVEDERFLDENNLITYCKDCHYFKIHKYKHNKDN